MVQSVLKESTSDDKFFIETKKKSMAMHFGLIGCGAIGSRIACELEKSFSSVMSTLSICEKNSERLNNILEELSIKPFIYDDYKTLIKNVDFVIECAGVHLSADIAKKDLSQSKSVLLLSVGGLVNNESLMELAKTQKASLLIPSGAIAGLDAFLAMSLSDIKKVHLITRKPIHSVLNTSIWKKKSIDPKNIKEEFCLFEGSAREAIASFPKNINVSVTLSLATLGFDKTKVSLYVSPYWTKNSHEIQVESSLGVIRTFSQSVPLSNNPSTSALAYFSAVALLKKHFSYVKIGV